MIKEFISILVLICLIKPSFCNNLRNISIKNICIFFGIYLFLKILITREKFDTFKIKYPYGVNLNMENRITINMIMIMQLNYLKNVLKEWVS